MLAIPEGMRGAHVAMVSGVRGEHVMPTSDEEDSLMLVSPRTQRYQYRQSCTFGVALVSGVLGVVLCALLLYVAGQEGVSASSVRALQFLEKESGESANHLQFGAHQVEFSTTTVLEAREDRPSRPSQQGNWYNFGGDDKNTTTNHHAKPNTTNSTTQPSTTTATTRTTVTHTTITHTVLPTTTTPRDLGPHSLFCFLLCIPWGSENELVQWQFENKKGIFGCDIPAVYSNTTVDLGGVLKNKIVHTWLESPIGGQWNTRLNTKIFTALWSQVVKDGEFRHAAWTVKVDPDAVFLASRLYDVVRTPLHDGAQDGNGMFSNNCEYQKSMHGPLELFSRRAVEVLGDRGEKECEHDMVYGPGVGNTETFPNLMVEWQQEDVFMRKCMELLGAKEINDWKLLAEDSCHWDWQTCEGDHVAFHPYKTLKAYTGCLWRAEHSTKWSVSL